MQTSTKKDTAWLTPQHIDCADKINEATNNFLRMLASADEMEIAPARIRDFVNDIERYTHFMKGHLNKSQEEYQKRLA